MAVSFRIRFPQVIWQRMNVPINNAFISLDFFSALEYKRVTTGLSSAWVEALPYLISVYDCLCIDCFASGVDSSDEARLRSNRNFVRTKN